MGIMEHGGFDIQLARNLADAFSKTTGVGCVVKDGAQEALCAVGYTCAQCSLCSALGRDLDVCGRTHQYGMAEAERFGGRYIYYCNRGLTFLVSPIIGSGGQKARVTAGPFLMVEGDDFCACELGGKTELMPLLSEIPFLAPDRATHASTLLYMAAGYLNSVSALEKMHRQDVENTLQQRISAYIAEVKLHTAAPSYPYALERELLEAMRGGSKEEAQRLLSDLLGHIMVSTGASLDQIKAQVNLLLTAMLRTIADIQDSRVDEMSVSCYTQLQHQSDFSALCSWLSSTTADLMDLAFRYKDARHADAIHRCIQYIRTHLSEKLTLEEVAGAALLSPSYFSRIFREETGQTVQQFVLQARLQKAAELLNHGQIKLVDVALMTGFQDASYFSRAFHREYGMSPSQYRRRRHDPLAQRTKKQQK